MRKHVRLVRLCLVAFFLIIFSGVVLTQEEEPEKSYRILSGGFDIGGALSSFPEGTFRYQYRPSDGEPTKAGRDLAHGHLVPVSIQNYSSEVPLTTQTSLVSWTEFVSVEVKYVLDEEQWTLEEPGSTYNVNFYTRLNEEKDTLSIEFESPDSYDEIWFIIEFDSPELLKDGKYVWKPRVDFDALGAALPDLSSENLFEVPSFRESAGASLSNQVTHSSKDLTIDAQAREAVNSYLYMARKRFVFGKEQEARQFLQEAFDINPNSAPAYVMLALIDFETERVQEALVGLLNAKQLVEANGDEYLISDEELDAIHLLEIYKWIGKCYHWLEDFINAERYYLLAIDKLRDPAFSPGPDVSDQLSSDRSRLRSLVQLARNQEP